MTDNKKLFIIQWLIIVVFSVLIGLLILQNVSLKKSHPPQISKNCDSLLFETGLDEHFLFKKFPMEIKLENFYFNDENKLDYANGYVIMIFDLTVCGHCLHEELGVLGTYKEALHSKNIAVLAITGIVDKKEEADIINLRKSRAVFFPCKTVNVQQLYDMFHLPKEHFLDTPFFIYTSHTFKVLDIFKPKYMDNKGLETWLRIVTDQEIF